MFSSHKNNIINLIRDNKLFFVAYIMFAIICITFICLWSKFEIILFTNSLNNKYLDLFFKYITTLGEEIVIFPILIISLFFLSYKNILMFIPCYIIAGGITQFLKRFIFYNYYRPNKLMTDFDLHYVEGVEVANYFSFPSGHTTIAFAFWSFMYFSIKRKKLGLCLFLICFLVGYSRVYLLQHFLEDVLVGSLVGLIISFITYYIYKNIIEKKLNNKSI